MYAIIANVSRAARDSREGEVFSIASIKGANMGWVRNWYPPATSLMLKLLPRCVYSSTSSSSALLISEAVASGIQARISLAFNGLSDENSKASTINFRDLFIALTVIFKLGLKSNIAVL